MQDTAEATATVDQDLTDMEHRMAMADLEDTDMEGRGLMALSDTRGRVPDFGSKKA